jgi:hypothetical protein
MKKLLLLFLLVAGGVSTASAWTGNVRGSFNSWSETENPFIYLSSWEMYAKLPGSIIHDGSITFKPYIDGKGFRGPKGQTSDYTVATDGITYYGTDSDAGSLNFVIAQNENAKDIYVHLKTYDDGSNNWWEVKVLVVENYTSYTINYTDNDSWSNVYAYITYNSIPLVNSWPGTKMTDGSVTLNALPGSNVIFNNNSGSQYGGYNLVNGNYDKTGLKSENTSVSAAGFATYVSPFALDYTSTAIKAYTAEVNTTNGKVTLTKIDKVPANTPVVLYKEGGATEDIPVAGSTDTPGVNDLVAGTGAAVYTSEDISETTYYNYILNNVSGIGFYKANNQIVASNRAYLHTTFNVDPGSGARMTMVFADETTGIKDVNTTSNNRYFDLQGRSVAQPTKGLYIVNGKKVIKK